MSAEVPQSVKEAKKRTDRLENLMSEIEWRINDFIYLRAETPISLVSGRKASY